MPSDLPSSEKPSLFDINALIRNRNRAAATFSQYDFLKQAAVERLADRLALVKRDFSALLDVGCHGGQLITEIRNQGLYDGRLDCQQLDIAPAFVAQAQQIAPASLTQLDILNVNANQFDCAASALFLHWAEDLIGLLTQVRLALQPDGFFVANLLGGRSLSELRAVLVDAETAISGGSYPRISPMADIRDLGAVMQRAGFALPVIDAELITVTYPNMFALMADLKGMGEQNILTARPRHFSSKKFFMEAAERYQDRFSTEDGQIKASFELITMTGWSPAASQPQPLRPGSAQMRLATALETTEQDPLSEQDAAGSLPSDDAPATASPSQNKPDNNQSE